MKLVRWAPFMEPFEDWDKDLEGFASPYTKGFAPALDVYQDKDNVIVEAPLAGVDPEKVNISIENDVLSISGQAEKKTEVDEKDYYRKEVKYGSFYRSVALPVAVQSDKANAEYENGILKITIPKSEEAKPKKIKVAIKK